MEKREMISDSSTASVYRTDDPSLVLVSRKDTLTDLRSGRSGNFPGKGALCSRMSAHVFRYLETQGLRTAFVEETTDTDCLFRETERIPLRIRVRSYSAGAFAERTGLAEGTALPQPTAEFRYCKEGLGEPMINGYDALALKLVTETEIEKIVKTAFRVNELLSVYFAKRKLDLVDLSVEFGRYKEELLITGEYSPDTMRLWDSETHERLDSERFLKNLGNVQDAYAELGRRLGLSGHSSS